MPMRKLILAPLQIKQEKKNTLTSLSLIYLLVVWVGSDSVSPSNQIKNPVSVSCFLFSETCCRVICSRREAQHACHQEKRAGPGRACINKKHLYPSRAFFIFIFFENIFYRNIFSISHFTVLYPYRPAGGRQGACRPAEGRQGLICKFKKNLFAPGGRQAPCCGHHH